MRKLTFIMVIVTAVVFISCNKNNDDNSGNPASNGSMSLKNSGTSWSASLSVQGLNANGVINITGSDSNANQVAITVNGASGPGTYQIGPGANPGNSGRWTQGLAQTDSYTANNVIGTGEITFTELSATSAKGTFSFTGYNISQVSVAVTEGSFNVTF